MREFIGSWLARADVKAVEALLTESVRFICAAVLEKTNACEGSLWWRYPETDYLEVCYNSGPEPERLIAKVRQPLTEGIISLVFHTGEPAYTNQINDNPDHSKQIDRQLAQETKRMLACPLVIGGEIVGVISAVVLDSESEKKFGFSDLAAVQHLSELLQAYWEHAILAGSEESSI